MGSNELVTIAYDSIVTETPMAMLFKAHKDEFWIPKSLIKEHNDQRKEIEVPAWFAENEGLV